MSEPRKFSEVKAERAEIDPKLAHRLKIMFEIDRLEREARGLQCQAEELRCSLYHDTDIQPQSQLLANRK
jgi:hypothetical protein